jgi:hypothetical protein
MSKRQTYLKGGYAVEPEREPERGEGEIKPETEEERKEAEKNLILDNCSGLGECDDDIVSFGKSITSPNCPLHEEKIKTLIKCYNKNHIFKLKTKIKPVFVDILEQDSYSRDMEKAVKWIMKKSDPNHKSGFFSSMKKKYLEKIRGKPKTNYRETIRPDDPIYQNIEGVNDDLSPYEKTGGKTKSKKTHHKRTRKLARNGKRKSRKSRRSRRSRSSRSSRRN